ncbi:hypothetical protein [Nesterenkonia sp. DZ6]|uniref:hypothetical protein n=1 Tax=Nesterenkonia sp. DZ6 TaxID=2901229 RepID=UPI001F4CCC3D|nr:hypothetical protein [Nesterenkonia sp. DZ6]MCH8559737.1 hypothetical protein [Nesterenkonia sp. DZ6]
MSDSDTGPTGPTGPAALRIAVRGPEAVPTVREALLTRSQAADHARTAGADSDQRAQAVRGLIRAQLRLALILGVGFFCTVVVTSLLLVTTGLGSLTLWGVPLTWAVPGVGFFPVLLGLAWYFRRRSEANEQLWAEVLGLSLQSPGTRPRTAAVASPAQTAQTAPNAQTAPTAEDPR